MSALMSQKQVNENLDELFETPPAPIVTENVSDDSPQAILAGINALEKSTEVTTLPINTVSNPTDIKDDYSFIRTNLKTLVGKGAQALDELLIIAKEGEHPRAYEVAGQLIKSIGDTTDKLMDLQKKVKELEATEIKDDPKGQTTNIQNNIAFVGTSEELLDRIAKGMTSPKVIEGKSS